MEIPIAYPIMGDSFEKILDDSRDFFSGPEEESEVVAMIRRNPDAILSGKHKPFMKKLAEAIIRDRPKDFHSQIEVEMLKAKIATLEADLRELTVRVNGKEDKPAAVTKQGKAKGN